MGTVRKIMLKNNPKHGKPALMTRDFSEDAISIGAFHAMAKGVLTLNSAGNSGPGLTASVAPWLMSVAASTTDRLFVDKVALGNGKAISEEDFRWECNPGCVNGSLVKGKIVICLSFKNYHEVRKAGAAGSVLLNNEFDKVCFVVSLPAVAVTQDSFSILISYKESTKTPVAEILKTEAVKDFDAPVVVGFSLRGPNAIVPEILKQPGGVQFVTGRKPEWPVPDIISRSIRRPRVTHPSLFLSTHSPLHTESVR
ncbi:hypothetical protein KPL70_008295 [Citrus sinensis]|nr:hypothetical protein KPL70_008295 [Citrus sinensis]